MASYTTDLAVFDLADTNANWEELTGHTTGAAPATSTENYYHNSVSVDQAMGQAIGTNGGVQCDYGSAITWTSGHVFTAWQKFDAATNIYSWSAGGMRFGIGSSAGNMNFWNALGDDFGNYPSGGWQNTAIDPEFTADATDGTPVAGTYQFFGSNPNMRAKISKGSPHVCDVIRYGRGEFIVTGTGATLDGMATANDALTARWGLFSKQGSTYKSKGLVSLGTAGLSVTMTDSSKAIEIEDTPRVSATFNRFEVNNASSSITWTAINVTGVSTSITGVAPTSKWDFIANDNATISHTDCIFTDVGIFNYLSNSTITGSTYIRTEPVTQSGATFTGATFDDPDTTGLIVDNLTLVTKCTFNSSGTGHGVDLGTISATVSKNWDNNESGYASVDGATGNETILVSVDSGITLTINVVAGASTPTVYNTGLGTVNVVAGLVTLTVATQNGNEVRFKQGSHTLQHTQDVTGGQVTYTYSYAADTKITVSVGGASYSRQTINLTLASTDTLLDVQLIPDPSYI